MPAPVRPALPLLLLALAAVSGAAHAQDRAATERRLSGLRAQIQSAERAVQRTRGEETTALASVEAVDAEIRLREQLVSGYQQQVVASRAETDSLRRTIARLEGEIERAKAGYRARARHAYMYGRRSALGAILSAGSVTQMLVRARYLQQFARQRRRQVERIDATTGEVRARETDVRSLLETTQRTLLQSQAEAVELGQRRRERTALVASLRDRRSVLERELAQRRSDAREMEALVRQLVAGERARAEAAEAARVAEAAEAQRRADAARAAEVQRQADLAARRAAEAEQIRRRPTPRAEAARSETEIAQATPRPRGSTAPAADAPRRTEGTAEAPRRADAAPTVRRTDGSGAPPVRRVDEAPRPAARPTPRTEPPRTETARVEPPRTAPARPEPRAEAPRPAPRPAPAVREAPESREETVGGSFGGNRGRLPWPADGTVVGAFGPRRDPVHGTTISSIGIDIATAAGAPARAVFEGTVERVGQMASFGTYVMVSHGAYTTVYGNLSAVTVDQGATVRAGQAIGRSGTSGDRRGTQLFFAVFQDGRPVNPTLWLR